MGRHGIDIDFKKIVKQYWETFLPESPELSVIEQTRAELLQWFAGDGTVGSYRKPSNGWCRRLRSSSRPPCSISTPAPTLSWS